MLFFMYRNTWLRIIAFFLKSTNDSLGLQRAKLILTTCGVLFLQLVETKLTTWMH